MTTNSRDSDAIYETEVVQQFSSSEQTLDPSAVIKSPAPRKTLTNKDKEEIVKKWKANTLETKAVVKSCYVPVVQNKKVTGHICNVCEKYFIGKLGGAQYQHKCVKRTILFTSAQKESANSAAVKMVTSDLMKFNTITKDGFLKYTAEMMKLGSELGLNVTKNLDAQSVKELLPHPSTISNHINKIPERKDELFAHLRKQTEKSGMSLMIDGTFKSYHYTGIIMTYIDENWQLKKLLVELIADIERGGQAAEYAVTKINDFVTEFGITMEDLNAIVTDEAAPMKAAFQKTGKHIICPCHLCSTISKHSSELYAVDKKKLPELDKLLQKVRDLLQKLKDVITLIRGRIYILEKLSISLHQSNATRWLSSLTSIESFLALTEADHALIYEELKGHVSVSKYLDLKQSKNQLQCIFNVLHPTRHLIRQFEAEKTPTLHLVVPGLAELYNHYSTIVNSDDWIEVSMKEAGRLAIKEKVPLLHDYHYYAVILDPNAKNKIESYILPDRAGNKKTVPDLMDGLKTSVYNYAVKSGKYQPPQITSAIISPYAAHIQAPEEDFMRIINSEIDRYLLDASTYSTYLLGYWRNALNYPYLSYYAKFIFSIMASSSPIERSFSVLNKVDCKDRPQLGQETISNIVISNAVEQYLKVENV